ncbi:MAG: hypothetical protein K2J79_02565, partial [Ruminiclostridium sp.]|nr:hypothetical protein [Ruminiclostridium sp.]
MKTAKTDISESENITKSSKSAEKEVTKDNPKENSQDNLISKIQEKMGSFSKSQRLIGNFIIQHYERASYMT